MGYEPERHCMNMTINFIYTKLFTKIKNILLSNLSEKFVQDQTNNLDICFLD